MQVSRVVSIYAIVTHWMGSAIASHQHTSPDGRSRSISFEVVWGDGTSSNRLVMSATDLPAMGRHHFEIPFDASGKKWVRFAAWDCAGNGAMTVKLGVTARASGR